MIAVCRAQRDILAMVKAAHPMAVSSASIARILGESLDMVESVLDQLLAQKSVEMSINSDGNERWRAAGAKT